MVGCDDSGQEVITENDLALKVSYGDEISTQTVFESNYKVILFAMRKGQDLKPHSAPMDAPMIMLEGSARVVIGEAETVLTRGDMLILPKEQKHGVTPITDCKFMLLK